MKKVETTNKNAINLANEEIEKLVSMIEGKAEAEHKVKYYKNLLLVSEEIYDKIQLRINAKRKVAIHFVLGFIPIITINRLDGMDVALLKRELIEIEDTVFTQKNYYENWLDRVREYNEKMEEITMECNANFDNVLEEAKQITYNIILQTAIQNYNNPTNDQEKKNIFFLTMQKHILNSKVYKKR